MNVKTITSIFPRAKNALGIVNLHFHDLRHEGVSMLFEQGYQIHEVALISGQMAVTLDGYAASHRAVRELQQQGRLAGLTKLRSSKYLHNLVEQDHRNTKSRFSAMLA